MRKDNKNTKGKEVKIPNLFIVGAQRSGSTALYKYLKKHPQIFLSDPKEPKHFNTDRYREKLANCKGKKQKKQIQKEYYYLSEKNYKKLFSRRGKEKYVGEATAGYLYSKEAAKNIKEFNPDAKIIIILREPSEFIYSYHHHLINTYKSFNEEFMKVLNKKDKRVKGIPAPTLVEYDELTDYKKQIKRYVDQFPNNQIKVLILEKIIKEKQQLKKLTQDFLDVKHIEDIPLTKENEYSKIKNPELIKTINTTTITRIIKQWLKRRAPKVFIKANNIFLKPLIYKKAKKPKLDPNLKTSLMKKYKKKVEELDKFLHQERLIANENNLITLWGYDKL